MLVFTVLYGCGLVLGMGDGERIITKVHSLITPDNVNKASLGQLLPQQRHWLRLGLDTPQHTRTHIHHPGFFCSGRAAAGFNAWCLWLFVLYWNSLSMRLC